MFTPRREMDLRMVVFFLLCKMEDSRTIPTVNRFKFYEAVRVLLAILRAYFKDDRIFEAGGKTLAETMNEVILDTESQGVLRVEPGEAEFSFVANQHEKLQENCAGISHNDHWVLQNCCAVAVASYRNNVTVEGMFSPTARV